MLGVAVGMAVVGRPVGARVEVGAAVVGASVGGSEIVGGCVCSARGASEGATVGWGEGSGTGRSACLVGRLEGAPLLEGAGVGSGVGCGCGVLGVGAGLGIVVGGQVNSGGRGAHGMPGGTGGSDGSGVGPHDGGSATAGGRVGWRAGSVVGVALGARATDDETSWPLLISRGLLSPLGAPNVVAVLLSESSSHVARTPSESPPSPPSLLSLSIER